MIILINTLVFIIVFSLMEFVAWWTHKYLMHGILWILHQDHHNKNTHHFYEKNDLFALIFAVPSIIFIIIGTQTGLDKVYFWIGSGIAFYGAAYFFAHDVFIHQRIKLLRNVNIKYFKALRRAHKIHHKHLNKENGESFGFLWVPKKYREDLNILK
ncbi:MAG: sterol desaturase family protein [Ignavibacteria bacterium]